MSFPFQGRKLTFTQPDGTPLDVVGWGDQTEAVFETTGGYTIVPDADRVYRYAVLSPSGDLVPTIARADGPVPDLPGLTPGLRAVSRSGRGFGDTSRGFTTGQRRCEQRWEERQIAARDPSRAPPTRGTVGTFRGLCLLIQFPDVPGTISRQEVESFCNLPGYTGFGNKGSVFDYYLDVSRGRLKYTNRVVEYYTAKHPRAYYTDESVADGVRTRELITEALQDLVAKSHDFTDLSVDADGFVYALNIFYAGPCINNWPHGLWPHSWRLAQPFELGGPTRAVFDYQITNIGSELTLATFCHENGHMICDFPDFYDYGYESYGDGNYCLMAFSGTDEKNPVNVCAYLRYKAGWIGKVTPMVDGMTAELACDGDEVLMFAKSSTEYFLVENRFQKGRDVTLPASGLAIWHVDERGSNNNEQMTPTSHYECTLVQADGKWDLERKRNQGDAADLFSAATASSFSDTTSPSAKWWNGSASKLKIRDISAPGERMTLRVGDTQITTPSLLGEATPGLAIPDNTPAGVKSAIALQGGPGSRVGGVEVDVQIKHTYRGDLTVSLVSPSGTSVLLHNRTGGSDDDLRARYTLATTPALKVLSGEPIAGSWTLAVADLGPADTGTLEKWSIAVTPLPGGPLVIGEEPGTPIPDNDVAGITRTLACGVDGTVASIEVKVEITHTYVGDLEVSLTSPAGTQVALHSRTGGSDDNLFRTYTVTSLPALSAFVGQSMRGDWTLKVADRAGQDIGKLARWSVQLG